MNPLIPLAINLVLILVFCIIFGVIGMALGDLGKKKNGKIGFLLGFLLGPLGVIITPFLPAGAQVEKSSNAGKLLIAGAVIAGLMVAGWVWLRFSGLL